MERRGIKLEADILGRKHFAAGAYARICESPLLFVLQALLLKPPCNFSRTHRLQPIYQPFDAYHVVKSLELGLCHISFNGFGLGGVAVDVAPANAFIVAFIVQAVPHTSQVNDGFARILLRDVREFLFFVGYDQNVRSRTNGIEVIGHELIHEGNLGHDEVFVRVGVAGNLHVPIVDAYLVSLAQQAFDNIDDWAATQIVCAALEAEAQDADFATALGLNDFQSPLLLELI